MLSISTKRLSVGASVTLNVARVLASRGEDVEVERAAPGGAAAGQTEALVAQVEKRAEDAFPANRLLMHCSLCGGSVPRYTGYHHRDQKRTLCRACHVALGYPVRELDVGADGV